MRIKFYFVPLLLLYIAIILLTYTHEMIGDEGRYLKFVSNLTKGYFSPSGDDIFLWCGPGYPLILLPFAFLKLPWIAAKLFNSVLLYFAIIYFYNTLLLYMEKKPAIYFSYLLGVYLPFFKITRLLYTETLIIFLICGFMFYFCNLYKNNNKSPLTNMLLASFFLGYLSLTKVIFGWVTLTGIIFSLILYFLLKKKQILFSFYIYLIALSLCVPYLCYTYSLTGKIFYWSHQTGQQLYYMTSPHPGEMGEWFDGRDVRDHPELSKNHFPFLRSMKDLNLVEKDDLFLAKAIENIKEHPSSYLKNWFANIGRLLFNYPYSYTNQKLTTYFYLIPNMFLFVIFSLCAFPVFWNYKFVYYELYAILFLALIYLGGSSLVSAWYRQLLPIIPPIALWISFILENTIRKLRSASDNSK